MFEQHQLHDILPVLPARLAAPLHGNHRQSRYYSYHKSAGDYPPEQAVVCDVLALPDGQPAVIGAKDQRADRHLDHRRRQVWGAIGYLARRLDRRTASSINRRRSPCSSAILFLMIIHGSSSLRDPVQTGRLSPPGAPMSITGALRKAGIHSPPDACRRSGPGPDFNRRFAGAGFTVSYP
jgi:hypothetical protein